MSSHVLSFIGLPSGGAEIDFWRPAASQNLLDFCAAVFGEMP
jgi:hypothetical protein